MSYIQLFLIMGTVFAVDSRRQFKWAAWGCYALAVCAGLMYLARHPVGE